MKRNTFGIKYLAFSQAYPRGVTDSERLNHGSKKLRGVFVRSAAGERHFNKLIRNFNLLCSCCHFVRKVKLSTLVEGVGFQSHSKYAEESRWDANLE